MRAIGHRVSKSCGMGGTRLTSSVLFVTHRVCTLHVPEWRISGLLPFSTVFLVLLLLLHEAMVEAINNCLLDKHAVDRQMAPEARQHVIPMERVLELNLGTAQCIRVAPVYSCIAEFAVTTSLEASRDKARINVPKAKKPPTWMSKASIQLPRSIFHFPFSPAQK